MVFTVGVILATYVSLSFRDSVDRTAKLNCTVFDRATHEHLGYKQREQSLFLSGD